MVVRVGRGWGGDGVGMAVGYFLVIGEWEFAAG